jgi:hypothetical protein
LVLYVSDIEINHQTLYNNTDSNHHASQKRRGRRVRGEGRDHTSFYCPVHIVRCSTAALLVPFAASNILAAGESGRGGQCEP